MTPFIIGAVVGLIAAAVLTFAYHRMRGVPALLALMGTLVVSLLPRLYFGMGALQGTQSQFADFDYTSAWMLVVAVGFFIGYAFLGRFLKGSGR